MIENKRGLIINVSSGGGLRYLFNVAYGVGKAACDRMAADCAMELKAHNVAMISLWPGAVKTEKVKENVLGNLHNLAWTIFILVTYCTKLFPVYLDTGY